MTDVLRIRAARRRLLAMGCALALGGCGNASLPALTSGPDPADPRAGRSSVDYAPVTAGTMDHQPVEPKPWREMNERVTPRRGGSP